MDEAGPKLKVCVVGSGTTFVSGISYYTYYLGHALKDRYDVVAILMRHLIPRRWYPGRDRVGHSVMAYDLATEVPAFDGIDWWALPSVPRALSFLRSQQPDVVILQWWSASVLPWYLLIAREATRRGSTVIIVLHEDLDPGEASLPLLGPFAQRGLRGLCRMASALIVHSAWDRERISASLGISPDVFRVIPHGPYPVFDLAGEVAETVAAPGAAATPEAVAAPRGAAATPEAVAAPRGAATPDAAAPTPEVELTLLFFGTIRPYKGLEHLVEAFERIRRDSGLPWKLVVVGETWEGWTLPIELIERSPYRDDIELVNRYVTDEEAAGYFARADVVALPYLRSSASGPLAMAQACGLPVVITAVGGLVEAVAEYTGAVLVAPGDPDDLVRGLLQAAKLRGTTHTVPVTWDAVADSYAEIFAAVGAGRPASGDDEPKPGGLLTV
jgi:glycosyltransferase involved in cell wall biosynthesis